MDYSGLKIHARHPNPAEAPLELPLLDSFWPYGSSMPYVIDVQFENSRTIERYQASEIKKIGKFPVGGLNLPLSFKPGTSIAGFFSADPLTYSDTGILNALSKDLYNSSGDLVIPVGQAYKKLGTILRTWIYRENRTTTYKDSGVWSQVEISADWSVGTFNLLNTSDTKTGEHPFPSVDGARNQHLTSALFSGVNGADWVINSTFRDIIFNFFNVFFAPNASISSTFPGPLTLFVGTPTNGMTFTTTGTQTLVSSIAGYNYDCGTVTWTIKWLFTTH